MSLILDRLEMKHRAPSDSLREQLAEAVELLNAEQDHDARIVLIREISELRDRLGISRGGPHA